MLLPRTDINEYQFNGGMNCGVWRRPVSDEGGACFNASLAQVREHSDGEREACIMKQMPAER